LKLLIVGCDKVYAIENFYVKYFRKLGVPLDTCFTHSMFVDYYHGFTKKVLFRLGVSGIYTKINNTLRDHIENNPPDVIWVFKGMEIFPETLRWARAKKIKLVNFNGDNPFLFSGRGSGNANVTQSISLYDLHFTYNLDIKKKLDARGGFKTALLPFAFDVAEELFTACAAQEEVNKVCFLGNPDKDRAAFILELARAGVALDVYGHNWSKFIRHENVSDVGPVYGDEQWKVLRKYRVQLNLMRRHNPNSHNMRSFEIPAIGGIMLAPDTEEHRLFFEDGREVFLFKDSGQAIALIHDLLSLNSEKAIPIRAAARHRCVTSGYSYEARTAWVWEELKKLF
jgi:spore maturation protein CgeB